ncbi:MAG: hypothetical protein QOE59_1669 [Actinomycetota bacterium]|nr:hypothetical protein [Actinomycetota bacterium]
MADSITSLAAAADTDADFERLGLTRGHIQVWEDGARTDGRGGTYEWWYFDGHLDDGATLVVVFLTKRDLNTPGGPLEPTIMLDLDLPDGTSRQLRQTFDMTTWSAATDRADVRIGPHRFSGDLHTYRITAALEDVTVDVTLTGQVPPWRPGTGVTRVGSGRNLEFCWLPAVPQGHVAIDYTVGGTSHTTTGTGYHDHNWGNVAMMKIFHDWYWARGKAGPYSVITSFITAHAKYNYTPLPVFMVAKDGQIIADDPQKVTFSTENVHTDRVTGKPVADITRYTYRDGLERYVVTFTRAEYLVREKMIDQVHGLKRLGARIVRFDGAYLRFAGDVHVEHVRAGELVDEAHDRGIWELMYFGHARPPAF